MAVVMMLLVFLLLATLANGVVAGAIILQWERALYRRFKNLSHSRPNQRSPRAVTRSIVGTMR